VEGRKNDFDSPVLFWSCLDASWVIHVPFEVPVREANISYAGVDWIFDRDAFTHNGVFRLLN